MGKLSNKQRRFEEDDKKMKKIYNYDKEERRFKKRSRLEDKEKVQRFSETRHGGLNTIGDAQKICKKSQARNEPWQNISKYQLN